MPSLFVLLRFVLPLPWSVTAKILTAIVLLGVSQFHLWSRLSSGSVFTPEMPRAIVIAFNVGFGAIVLLAVFQLVSDLLRLPALLIGQGGFAVPAGVRYGMGLVALALAGVGGAQAARVPPVRDVDVTIPGLPAAFNGYTMVQLTDLHISRLFPARWTEAVVTRTNSLNPDLIVITGDFIDGSIAMRRADVAPLARLRATDGVLAIPGNHEYFFEYDGWMQHLAGLGMRMLPNAHAVLTRGDGQLVIAGVTDLSARATGHPAPDLAKALAGAPVGAPIILLDHQPRMARTAAARGVALQLSGHTHGGMIVGLDRIVARATAGFVSGRYAVDGMTLYVNNGTGLWPGFALRLGVPSELTRITLRAAQR